MNIKEKLACWVAQLIAYVKLFSGDVRAESADVFAPVTMLIGGIIWVIIIPIFVTTVGDTNTTGWNFTGSAGAIVLFLLMPFAMIAGGVIWLLKKVL